MEYWEFLLQQEGDSNWLPLDTSQMEILEGRYRIMAHCSQAETPVEVYVSQLLTEQSPPKRRSLNRQGKTNENGLMVVLPFTRLTAGIWDIYCQGPTPPGKPDPNSTQSDAGAPEPWRYAIQLRVLPQDVGEDGDWFSDDGRSNVLEGAGDTSSLVAEAREPGMLTPTAATWADVDLQQVAVAMDQAPLTLAPGDEEIGSLYALALSQTAFMASQEVPIALTGQVSSVVEGESCSDMALVARLSDPQTAQTLTLAPFSLTEKTLPSSFAINLALPEGLATRLLLGELALVSWQAGASNLLAIQRFTVTVDLAALFDEIANRAETEADLDLVFAPDKLSPTSDPTDAATQGEAGDLDALLTVDFPVAPPRSVPTITLPRSQPTIPPKIYYPSPHEISARQPALPPLGRPKPLAQPRPNDASSSPHGSEASGTAATDSSTETSPGTVDSGTPAQPAASKGLNLPPLQRAAAAQNVGPAGDASRTGPSSTVPDGTGGDQAQNEGETLMLPSHETMGFQALNLQERFWTRLNDLAITLQQEANQARQEDGEAASARALDQDQDEPPPFVPFAGEVVIYEDAETPAAELTPEAAVALVNRLQNQEETEVTTPPVPEIEVASTKLVAGETVLLTLRVPYHLNRLYLKVWITDPQTRSLTDEPRQITHLAPNGRGQLEGSIQLTVPMGCLEVWLEAISVDMVTQQESYKASVTCSVNPLGEDFSDSLDEFEL